MEVLLSICLGLGLAAACGFRVFVPFLIMSVAAKAGHMELSPSFEWISADASLAVFAIATGLEITAYFVPWLDNLLDSMAAPTAVVAGVLVTAASIQDTSPLVTWSLAVVGGGGLAAAVQGVTTVIRGASSLMTAGVGNPLIAAGEAGGALTLSGLAVLLPAVAFILVMTVAIFAIARLGRRLASEKGASAP